MLLDNILINKCKLILYLCIIRAHPNHTSKVVEFIATQTYD